ncbi:MAG: hypothetical protein LBT03_00605 [Holosporales bacterium]|jgi:hypothetical protein|nr:hypothetical protein [Holosporales bacterium]
MKKFVIVALLGGIACGSCVCADVESRTEGDRPISDTFYEHSYCVIGDLVEMYREFGEKPWNLDVVDEGIRILARMADPLAVRHALDHYFDPKYFICDDVEEEQKIGQEIIQRWKDLGFSSKTRNP